MDPSHHNDGNTTTNTTNPTHNTSTNPPKTWLTFKTYISTLSNPTTLKAAYQLQRQTILPAYQRSVYGPDLHDHDECLMSKIAFVERDGRGYCIARLWEMAEFEGLVFADAALRLWKEVCQVEDWGRGSLSVSVSGRPVAGAAGAAAGGGGGGDRSGCGEGGEDGEGAEDSDGDDNEEEKQDDGNDNHNHNHNHHGSRSSEQEPWLQTWWFWIRNNHNCFHNLTRSITEFISTCIRDLASNSVFRYFFRKFLWILTVSAIIYAILFAGFCILSFFGSSLRAFFFDLILPTSLVDSFSSSLNTSLGYSASMAHGLAKGLQTGGSAIKSALGVGAAGLGFPGLYAAMFVANTNQTNATTAFPTSSKPLADDLSDAFDQVIDLSNVSIHLLPVHSLLSQTKTSMMGAADLVAASKLTYKKELAAAYSQLEGALGSASKSIRAFGVANELVLVNTQSLLIRLVRKLNNINQPPRSRFFASLSRWLLLGDGGGDSSGLQTRAELTAAIAHEFLDFLSLSQVELGRLMELIKDSEESVDLVQQHHRNLDRWRLQNVEEVRLTSSSLASKSMSSGWLFASHGLSSSELHRLQLIKAESRQLAELGRAHGLARGGLNQAKMLIVACQDDLAMLYDQTRWLLGQNSGWRGPQDPEAGREAAGQQGHHGGAVADGDDLRALEREIEVLAALIRKVEGASVMFSSARDQWKMAWLGKFDTCRGLAVGDFEECFFGRNLPYLE